MVLDPTPHPPEPDPTLVVCTLPPQQLTDDPELAEVVRLFVAGLGRRADTLTKALAAGDQTTLRREAFRLAGTARTFGFPSLAAAAADLETLLRDERVREALVDPARRLIDLCRRARLSAPQG